MFIYFDLVRWVGILLVRVFIKGGRGFNWWVGMFKVLGGGLLGEILNFFWVWILVFGLFKICCSVGSVCCIWNLYLFFKLGKGNLVFWEDERGF